MRRDARGFTLGVSCRSGWPVGGWLLAFGALLFAATPAVAAPPTGYPWRVETRYVSFSNPAYQYDVLFTWSDDAGLYQSSGWSGLDVTVDPATGAASNPAGQSGDWSAGPMVHGSLTSGQDMLVIERVDWYDPFSGETVSIYFGVGFGSAFMFHFFVIVLRFSVKGPIARVNAIAQ